MTRRRKVDLDAVARAQLGLPPTGKGPPGKPGLPPVGRSGGPSPSGKAMAERRALGEAAEAVIAGGDSAGPVSDGVVPVLAEMAPREEAQLLPWTESMPAPGPVSGLTTPTGDSVTPPMMAPPLILGSPLASSPPPRVAGVSGGVGTSTVAAAVRGVDVGQDLAGEPEVLVCRPTVHSIGLAQRAIGEHYRAVRPVLVVVSDGHGKPAPDALARLRLLDGVTSAVIVLPWVRSWRASGDPATEPPSEQFSAVIDSQLLPQLDPTHVPPAANRRRRSIKRSS